MVFLLKKNSSSEVWIFFLSLYDFCVVVGVVVVVIVVGFFFFVGGLKGLQSMEVRGSLISVDGNSHSLLLLNHNLEF